MKSFTIYEEYFDLITLLSKREQSELLLAICNYMFYDEEPILNEAQMKIYRNLKRPLDKSKKRSTSGSINTSNDNQEEKAGVIKFDDDIILEHGTENYVYVQFELDRHTVADIVETNKTVQDVLKNKKKTHQDVNVNVYVNVIKKIINNYFKNKEVLKERFYDFLEIREKLKAVNSDKAVKLLLKDLDNKSDIEQLAMIEKSIKNSWKGLYELNPQEKRILANIPEWFNKTILKKEPTEEEKKYLEELLREFK